MSYEIPNELVKFRVETVKGEDVLIFDHDASLMDREVARQIYEADKPRRDALDAARYRWLMEKRVTMAPASMDGPEFPSLHFSADIWNSRPGVSPEVRITEKIDAAIAAEKRAEK